MQNFKYTASEFHFYTSQLYYVWQVTEAPGGGDTRGHIYTRIKN